MSNPFDEIADLKRRHEAATRARIKAEHEQGVAEERLATLRARLQELYGVGTVEQAKTLALEFRDQLRAEIAAMSEALDEAESIREGADA